MSQFQYIQKKNNSKKMFLHSFLKPQTIKMKITQNYLYLFLVFYKHMHKINFSLIYFFSSLNWKSTKKKKTKKNIRLKFLKTKRKRINKSSNDNSCLFGFLFFFNEHDSNLRNFFFLHFLTLSDLIS